MDQKVVTVDNKVVTVKVLPWWQSKSLWAGLAAVLVSVVPQLFDAHELQESVEKYGTTVAGIVMVLLRFVTKAPIR